jgi:tRNA nucleotidyltransferase (CCA-adding enzyme)
VRDLLLRRPVRDLDLVVEGDGIAFARRLAPRLSSTALREHARFGTATLELPGGGRLDVATARSETYRLPGALPEVRPGPLGEDLARRDFTVNAMALKVAPGTPLLIDPYGGRADLARRAIRMLHADSARDDPTRCFRAVRYANRLGFRIEPSTRRWIEDRARDGMLGRLSGDRLRREITRILSEPNRAAAVGLLSRLGLDRAVHEALSASPRVRACLTRAERLDRASGDKASWFGYLLVWAAGLREAEAAALARGLRLPRAQARALARWPELRKRLQRASGDAPSDLSDDERLAAAACFPRRRSASVSVPLSVRGRDLVAAGIAPGPAIGRALAATRSARHLGRIAAEEELAFAVAAACRARGGE